MKSILSVTFLISLLNISFAGDVCEADWDYDDDGLTVTFNNDSETDEGIITGYFWEFGDGFTSTEENPVHTYSIAGEFIVCLSIETSGGCSDSFCNDVDIEGGAGGGCEADFNWDDDELYVEFTDDSDKGGSDIISYLWDFGDGITSNLEDPVHNFPVEGDYIVCLTIITAEGCSSAFCDELELSGTPATETCSAVFEISNIISDPTGFIVETNNASTGTGTFTWDFGDGSEPVISDNPGHYYPAAGTFTICLTIDDPTTNCYDEYCTPVTLTSNSTELINSATGSFILYPNPASDQLFINFTNSDDKSVEILNIYGETIISLQAKNNLEIPITHLPAGNYFLRVNEKNNYLIENFIIHH